MPAAGRFSNKACLRRRFRRDCAPQTGSRDMSKELSATAREIAWPSVITVVSAAILIGAEVFGGAFAGGWALSILFGLDETGAHILQGILFVAGIAVMFAFV